MHIFEKHHKLMSEGTKKKPVALIMPAKVEDGLHLYRDLSCKVLELFSHVHVFLEFKLSHAT